MKHLFQTIILSILTVSAVHAQGTENLSVKQVRPDFWVIQAITGTLSTMYLIEGQDSALLIDTGMGDKDLPKVVAELTKKPVIVAFTHGHGDHTGGAKYYKEIYMNSKDLSMVRAGNIKWKNLSEGQIIDLGTCQLEVIEVPGHTPGSVAFLDRKNRCIFTGDAIGSGDVWMQLRGCSTVAEYYEVLKKVQKLIPTFDTIWYGHEEQLPQKPAPAQYVNDMTKAAERVLAGDVGESYSSGGNSKALALRNGTARIVYDPDKIR